MSACASCTPTTRSTVVGCCWAAWHHLCAQGTHAPYDAVEAVYRQHSRQLQPLAGTDAIWQRLAELYSEQTARVPALF